MKSIIVTDKTLTWNFFYDNQYGICFKQGNNQNFEVLLKEGQPDFDVIIEDGVVHLVCQDDRGNILYLSNNKTHWQKFEILRVKSPNLYDKNFIILKVNKYIHLYYVVMAKNQLMLAHHILDNKNAPQIIDEISTLEFYAVTDKKKNTIISYKNRLEYIEFKYLSAQNKDWISFKHLSPINGNSFNIQIGNDVLHVVYQLHNSLHYLSASLADLKNAEWGEDTIVDSNLTQIISPIINTYNENISITWFFENKAIGCQSEDYGYSFLKPKQFLDGRFTTPALFMIRADDIRIISLGYISRDTVFLYGSNLNIPLVSQKSYEPIQPPVNNKAPENYSQPVTQNKETTRINNFDQTANMEVQRLTILVDNLSSELTHLKSEVNQIKKTILQQTGDKDYEVEFDKINGELARLKKNKKSLKQIFGLE